MKKPSNEEIIKRAEERFPPCKSFWERHHQRFTKIKAFTRCHGEYGQWTQEEYLARQSVKPPRLTLSENLLGPFVLQVANDLKQSEFGAWVKPKDSGADPKLAEVRQGLHRGVQQIGGFKLALNQAIEDLVDGGLGAFRFVTRRADPSTFRKEIEYLELDPTRLFHGDGNHRKADFSDVVDSFIYEPYSEDRFRAEFDKDPKQFLGKANCNAVWGNGNTPWVTEYFFKEEHPETLVMTTDGREVYLSDIKDALKKPDHAFFATRPDWKLLAELGQLPLSEIIAKDEQGEDITEPTTRCQIWWAKLAGKEVLSCEAWPGYFIPNFLATGRKVSINGQINYYGLAEPAVDVQRAHNFAFSALVERAGLSPKVRIFMPIEGMDPKYQAIYDNISTWNGIVPYHAVTEGGLQLDKPYQEPPIQTDPAFADLRAMTTQGIRDALGMWETSLGAQSQERSGVAIQARERQSDTGNYDWGANLAIPVELCFRATDELLPKVIDVPTQIRIVGEDDREEVIMAAALKDGDPNPNGYFDLNQGKYDIVCKMAPSADTKREDQRQGMEMLFQRNPAMVIGMAPEYVAIQDWKGADKLADVARVIRSANFPGVDFGDQKQTQLPPEAQQAMQQMQQQMQALQQQLQEMGPENERLKLENAAIKADKTNDTKRVEIEAFRAQVEAKVKGVDATVKQGTLTLKADQQQHDQQMDKVGLRMESEALQHGQAKDGAELNLKAQGQQHQQDKDRAAFEQAGEKMRLDHEAKTSAKEGPTGAKPGDRRTGA